MLEHFNRICTLKRCVSAYLTAFESCGSTGTTRLSNPGSVDLACSLCKMEDRAQGHVSQKDHTSSHTQLHEAYICLTDDREQRERRKIDTAHSHRGYTATHRLHASTQKPGAPGTETLDTTHQQIHTHTYRRTRSTVPVSRGVTYVLPERAHRPAAHHTNARRHSRSHIRAQERKGLTCSLAPTIKACYQHGPQRSALDGINGESRRAIVRCQSKQVGRNAQQSMVST